MRRKICQYASTEKGCRVCIHIHIGPLHAVPLTAQIHRLVIRAAQHTVYACLLLAAATKHFSLAIACNELTLPLLLFLFLLTSLNCLHCRGSEVDGGNPHIMTPFLMYEGPLGSRLRPSSHSASTSYWLRLRPCQLLPQPPVSFRYMEGEFRVDGIDRRLLHLKYRGNGHRVDFAFL